MRATVEPSTETKVAICTFFYEQTDVRDLSHEIKDTFREIAPNEINSTRPLTLSNNQRTVCILVLNDFVEVRTSEGEGLEEKKASVIQTVDALSRLSGLLRIVGMTVRFIGLVHYDKNVDLVHALNSVYLAKMPFVASSLRTEVEGLSMKFYFSKNGDDMELDIGNNRLDRSSLYIELEARRGGSIEAGSEFLGLWNSMENAFQLSLDLARHIVEHH